jgi:hypothetical protein
MNYYTTQTQLINDLKILIQVLKIKKSYPDWSHPVLSLERLNYLEEGLNTFEKEIKEHT